MWVILYYVYYKIFRFARSLRLNKNASTSALAVNSLWLYFTLIFLNYLLLNSIFFHLDMYSLKFLFPYLIIISLLTFFLYIFSISKKLFFRFRWESPKQKIIRGIFVILFIITGLIGMFWIPNT